jgi:hypothetical protein
MKLFEYAVLKQEKTDKDGNVTDEAAIVVPITPILAKDESQAQLLAARAIPEDEIANLDRLVVVLRGF